MTGCLGRKVKLYLLAPRGITRMGVGGGEDGMVAVVARVQYSSRRATVSVNVKVNFDISLEML